MTTAPKNEMLADAIASYRRMADSANYSGQHVANILQHWTDRLSATTSARDVREALDNSQSLLVMLHHVDSDAATWKHEGIEELLKEQISQNRSALSNLDAAAPAAGGTPSPDSLFIKGYLHDEFEKGWRPDWMKDTPPLQAPAHSDGVREANLDLVSHRSSWRHALEIARDHAPPRINEEDDRLYWEHELRAFDRTFAALTAPAAKAPAVSEADVGRDSSRIIGTAGEYAIDDRKSFIPQEYLTDGEKRSLDDLNALPLIQSAVQGGGTESDGSAHDDPDQALQHPNKGLQSGPSDPPSQEASAPPIVGGR